MTRRDWWLGIVLLALCLLFRAVVPRYEWQPEPRNTMMQVDRWTRDAQVGSWDGSAWVFSAVPRRVIISLDEIPFK
jgi:hypothetical protein